jgi:hypothetical protein
MATTSPLRQRMIEDMTIRNLSQATQHSYIYAVRKFSRHSEPGDGTWKGSRIIRSGRPLPSAPRALLELECLRIRPTRAGCRTGGIRRSRCRR